MRKEDLNDVVSYIFITLVHWLKESKMHTELLLEKAHQQDGILSIQWRKMGKEYYIE